MSLKMEEIALPIVIVLGCFLGSCTGDFQVASPSGGRAPQSSMMAAPTVDQLPKAPGVVYMNDYFPTRDNTRLYRYSLDGALANRIFLKQVIESSDPLFNQYGGSVVADRPGSTHYVLHDYHTIPFTVMEGPAVFASYVPTASESDAVYYSDSWHMRNHPDGEVAEVTDVVLGLDSSGGVPACTSPSCSNLLFFTYNPGFIGHGRPGGHVIGESPFAQTIDASIWTGGLSSSATHSSGIAFSKVWLTQYFSTYTAPQGSQGGGGFRKGGGRTYPGVVEVYFAMGAKVDAASERHCANQPNQLPHIAGYNTYWQRALLAPGIGWIEFDILFDEGASGVVNCVGQLATGLLNRSGQLMPGGLPPAEANKWVIFLDDPRTAQDIDTITYSSCADAGMPGQSGYFTSISHSTYNPATGQSSYIWDKNNHCL